MGKKIPLSIAIFLVACAAYISFQITYTYVDKMYSETIYEITSDGSSFSKINSIDEIVRKNYVGDIDEDSLEAGLIQGYLYGLGDKYATYMNKEDFQSYTAEKNGKMVGIGIKVIYDNTLGGMYVTSVTKESPAQKAGLLAGDIITAVDGITIAERGYYNTVSYISDGKEGEAVTLIVDRGPDFYVQEELTMLRAVVNTETVSYSMYEDEVGYVEISEFNKITAGEFTTAIESLISKGAKSFIFDVRNNPGGDLEAIRSVLDTLLPEGPIIRIVSKNGSEQVLNSDANSVEMPMAVIINGNTASAAELFSSALRDYEKATLVGTKTFGKGTMQTMMRLVDGSCLSISTQMYNPPYSENYEGIGVFPDIQVELTAEQQSKVYLLTLEEDPQFQAAYKALGYGEEEASEEIEETSEDKK